MSIVVRNGQFTSKTPEIDEKIFSNMDLSVALSEMEKRIKAIQESQKTEESNECEILKVSRKLFVMVVNMFENTKTQNSLLTDLLFIKNNTTKDLIRRNEELEAEVKRLRREAL